jgi:uncharacterized repeat protein (TIGR03803 family)
VNGTNADGTNPGDLIMGPDENLYGFTEDGGPNDDGTIFKMSTLGQLTTLHIFSATDSGGVNADGSNPAAIVFGPDSVLRGTTSTGGTNAMGTVFRLPRAGC